MGVESLFDKFRRTPRVIRDAISFIPHSFELRNREAERRQDEIVRALTSTRTAAGDPEPNGNDNGETNNIP